jgi:hypothetical protein
MGTTTMRRRGEHGDNDRSYLSAVLLPPGEHAALTISALDRPLLHQNLCDPDVSFVIRLLSGCLPSQCRAS